MGEFKLDTSGAVFIPDPRFPAGATRIRWEDLSPFAQGYVEASWREWGHLHPGKVWGSLVKPFGFSDLSPEALSMILGDCEAHQKTYGLPAGDPRNTARGRNFWVNRQTGMWAKTGAGLVGGFPPLRVWLDDDGKVELSPSQPTAKRGE